jgi:hypothetical protein
MRAVAIACVGTVTLVLTYGHVVTARQAQAAGVLSGILMSDDAAQRPVRRATVRLTGDALPSARLVGTDDDGRFVFQRLPAGSFTLSATRPGFVETFHGSGHPGRGPGVPIVVADGQHVDVALNIVPGAVITGLVSDPYGRPARSVPVLAVAVRASGSTTASQWRGTTDDRGEYRIFGLPPGEYLVSALPRLETVPINSAARSIGDTLGMTDAEARWAGAAAAGAGASLTSGSGAMPPPGRPVAYTPVYYPGTTNPAAAATVPVSAGEERNGVSLALRIVAVARIAGRLLDASGQPVEPATVAVYPGRGVASSVADRLVSAGAVILPRASVTGSAFTIAGLPPGDYTLVARSGSATTRATVNAPPASERLWSLMNISVSGADQTDIVLRFLPGMKLAGSVVFQGSSLARPRDMNTLALALSASGTLLGAASRANAVVEPNGRFRFESIAPGTYSLKAALPAPAAAAGWTLKSAMLNGRDLADVPLAVDAGANDLEGLVVTFTDRAASISGRLVDPGGQPVTRYSIVVATTDRSLWLPNARRIRAVQPATDGSFTVSGLPAGEYAIAAAEDVEAADLADPAFLEQLLAAAFKVTLADGEQKRQDLRVGG